MFGQSLLSAFGIACTTDTDQLFNPTPTQVNSLATYQLNNATTSIPSNTYPGTASNITYSTGKFGNAASFNGSSSYITLPANFLNSSTQTISAWVNPSTVSGSMMIYSSYDYQTGPSKGTILRVNSGGQIRLTVHDGDCATMYPANPSCTGVTQLDSPSAIPTNTWTHVVGVIGGSGNPMTLYINGANVASTPTMRSVGYWSGKQPLIGATDYVVNGTSYPAESYFNGSIDQVRFFSSALSQAAITALYNETTTTAQNAYITEEIYSGIAYYKMSDATDQLGNYNGTATNVNFNTEGKFGFAGKFNGSSSYISLPAGINKNNNFSWSFWYMFNTHTYYDTPIGFFMNGCTNFIDTPSSGELSFYDGNSRLTTPSSTFTAGTWYHVVVTKSSTAGRKFYVNGSVVATDSGNSNSGSSSGGRNLLGAYSSSGNPTSTAFEFDGKLDQIRIYDSAISAADVTTLYKEVECEPAAINALDHFNTVLYTGNGGTQSVTGVGFKPDFSWVKNRNTNGNSHELADVIRGVDNTLNSNTANGEYNNATYQFNSFDTDGITVTDDAAGNYAVNGNNETYVAWNWKAPLVNLSTNFNGSSSVGSASRIDLSGSTTLTTRSISLWVNLAGTGSGGNLILDNSDGQNPGVVQYGKWVIQLQYGGTNYFCWDTYNGSSYGICDVNYTFNLNTWYHIVFVAEANNQAVYINGVSQTLQNVSRPGDIGTVTMSTNRLGASWSTQYTHALNGTMGQVRIFNDALTASEVADLYAEPAASNNTLNYPAGAGCIAAYPLQTNAVDLSGNYSGASSNVTFGQPGYLTSNTDGTITSTVAANPEAGFSIVQCTSPSSTINFNYGHGLSKAPELVIVKTTGISSYWEVIYPNNFSSSGSSSPSDWNRIKLNEPDAKMSSNAYLAADSTKIYNGAWGANTALINYCFTSIPGYSKIGSYVGTAAAGNFQYTGFQPSWLMIKSVSSNGKNWVIVDDKRGNSDYWLYPNLPDDEEGPYTDVVFNSTGFTLGTNASYVNGSGDTYIFLAIA